MFKNYFKTAIRNLWRYKGFSFINILSLTIGIVGCLVIALFVWDEKQYDKFLPGAENIYRIYEQRNDNNAISYAACVPPAFADFLKHEYPEVSNTTRILMSNDKFLIENGEKKGYEEKGLIVDSNFFQIFPIKFLRGDANTALNDPNSLVISEDIAQRYFGNEDPVGRILKVNKSDVTIRAVFAKLPEHFHLRFQYLMPMSAAGLPAERMQRWTWHQFYTYVKLKPGADVQQLQNKFQGHMKKDIFPTLTQVGSTFLPFFQPLTDVHLKSSEFVYDNAVRGNETYVKALSIIALFVLVIACFNFINLATARSFRRAKEIGVRKVVGADRKQLIIQFIGETILLSVFSMLLATMATFIIVPWLNSFTDKAIHFNPFTNPLLALIIIAAGIGIGILAGIYPALILSGFQPIKVLKNMKMVGSGGASWIRHALVVVQFALSVLLIVSTIIVYKQTKYLNNKDLGFNKEQVVYFQVRDSLDSNPKTLETFKSELRNNPNILAVTSGYGLPGDQYAGDGITLPTKEGEKEYPSNVFIGDYDYAKTLGLRFIAGRDFSRQMSTDEREAFIINETAVKEWGFGTAERAIGQPIYWKEWAPKDTMQPMKKGKVIGVVQDFHYKNLHEKVSASVIQLYPQVVYKVAVKLKTAGIRNTLSFINGKWSGFVPTYPLDYKFMDETYGQMYKSEEKLSELLWIFTIMAIFIGCMGLFALAAFSAEQRTKEIGIRKVLGANVFNIVGLLSRNFLILVLIASLISFPIAWWTMNNWLKDFPYRVNISWWIFGIAIVAALLIAFITVSFQSIKAAITNPVKSLRTE
ncbi:MAG TPA: ABC transporter permease [Flavisolibacter sp.]|jgi:putative ABC transport system permease protein|nr:ABC transporter permease [Flavisolibacter sp.]